MLPVDVKPQKRKVEIAEVKADMEVMVEVEREKRFLSLRYPKKVEDAMPGMLNRVSKRVAED